MADIVKTNTVAKITNMFLDGDTRQITIKNPKPTITTEQITNLQNVMQTNNVIIGDKTGAGFVKIGKIVKVTTRKTEYDLS